MGRRVVRCDGPPVPSLPRTSLAWWAGWRRSAIISTLIVFAHAFFLYAQWGGQGQDCGIADPETDKSRSCPKHEVDTQGLLSAVVYAHTEFELGSLGYPVLEGLTMHQCYGRDEFMDCPEGRESPIGMQGMSKNESLCRLIGCNGFSFQQQVLHMAYWTSIRQMYFLPGKGTTPEGCELHKDPGCKATSYPGAHSAIVLFAVSFVWPHLKLVLLHLFYYLRLSAGMRRNGLYWFALFGKWSLADVLVMAVVIGLFNIQVTTSYTELWEDLQANDFEKVCIELCLTNTTQFGNETTYGGCAAGCDRFIDVAGHLLTPKLIPSSQLYVKLRLFGLGSVYAFCVAVIVSLATGVWIDHLDDMLLFELRGDHAYDRRRRRAKALRSELRSQADHAPAAVDDSPIHRNLPQLEHTPIHTNDPLVEDANCCPQLMPPEYTHSSTARWSEEKLIHRQYGMPPERLDERLGINQVGCSCGGWLVHAMHVVLLIVLLAVLLVSQFAPTFKRVVGGGIPQFLEVAGIDFDQEYNLWEIPRETAQEGGLDYLMAGSFLVFVLLAPILRVTSLLALLLLPLRLETQREIYTWSRRLVAFTATEVMLIATPLIGEAFGPISEKLVTAGTLAACRPLETVFGDTSPGGSHPCLRIDVKPLIGYWFKVAASVMMFVSGFDGTPTVKYIHRRLWPHDPYPPPSCVECCAGVA